MSNPHDLAFGEMAVRMGFCTSEQVQEAVRLQERMDEIGAPRVRLGELLVHRKVLTGDQVRKVLLRQGAQRGHQEIAGYRLLSKIGQGTMGAVYKARQISMDRIVAIKVLASKYAVNEKFRDRFLREARAVARLSHPNIIQGFDAGISNGIHYFAMEYVDGPTLGDVVRRDGPMEEARAIAIVTAVARALAAAYEVGITHRDIKPDNILIARGGSPKLCDLGLAKFMDMGEDPAGTRSGQSMGTPFYISPEQARGEAQVDTRSDLYSLGATFFHVVTGDVPFPAASAAEAIARHLKEEAPAVRSRNPKLTRKIDYIIGKMLRKEKERRYQTPPELVTDLEAVAAGRDPQGYLPDSVLRKAGPSDTSRTLDRAKLLKRARRFRR